MIEKKVLETRKRAYKEIMSLLLSSSAPVKASTIAIMVCDNHGFTRRFSDDYIRMLEDEGIVSVVRDGSKIVSVNLLREVSK